MTVKGLIDELLDMPMDAEVVVSYEDESTTEGYGYQRCLGPVNYEEKNQVGILGVLQFGVCQ